MEKHEHLHKMESFTQIPLKEYEELKATMKELIEENKKLNKAFEQDSKFIIVASKQDFRRSFFDNYASNRFEKKEVLTTDEFFNTFKELTLPYFKEFEELAIKLSQKREELEDIEKVKKLKKNRFILWQYDNKSSKIEKFKKVV